MQTAVTAYLKSKQLLLFAFGTKHCASDISSSFGRRGEKMGRETLFWCSNWSWPQIFHTRSRTRRHLSIRGSYLSLCVVVVYDRLATRWQTHVYSCVFEVAHTRTPQGGSVSKYHVGVTHPVKPGVNHGIKTVQCRANAQRVHAHSTMPESRSTIGGSWWSPNKHKINWHNVGLMLAHRLRRRPNNNPALIQCFMFVGVKMLTWPNATL